MNKPAAALTPHAEWEGDLPIEHLNRCKLRDNLLYADIFNEDGSHRASWRCCKREGHDGPCSSHNDCGVMNGNVVCGFLPGHAGPHAWATEIRAGAIAAAPSTDWQPLASAPPHERVLLSDGHYVVAGQAWKGGAQDDEGRVLTRATWWTPLPPPPTLAAAPAPRNEKDAND